MSYVSILHAVCRFILHSLAIGQHLFQWLSIYFYLGGVGVVFLSCTTTSSVKCCRSTAVNRHRGGVVNGLRIKSTNYTVSIPSLPPTETTTVSSTTRYKTQTPKTIQGPTEREKKGHFDWHLTFDIWHWQWTLTNKTTLWEKKEGHWDSIQRFWETTLTHWHIDHGDGNQTQLSRG